MLFIEKISNLELGKVDFQDFDDELQRVNSDGKFTKIWDEIVGF